MKNNLFLLIFLLSWCVPLQMQATPVSPVRTMDVPFATQSPAIDGVADEVYGPLQTTEMFMTDGYEGPADFEATFQVCWDYDYFYVICNVVDDVDDSYNWGVGNAWEFDHSQVYFQLDTNTQTTSYNNTTIQLRICRGLDSLETPGRAEREDFLYYMENAAPSGWMYEVGIPWTCVLSSGSDPEDIMDYIGSAIGFDMDAADSDNADGEPAVGSRDIQAAWDMDDPDDPYDRTEDNAWNNTSVFGYISLTGGVINAKPVANAGPDQHVVENTTVTLDGKGSYDPDDEEITYTWMPPGSITLSDIHSATPTFTAPDVSSNTSFNIGLIVNDGHSNSLTDYVRIYVNFENVAPVADAGPDQTVNERGLVMLDGSGSSDQEGQSLSFAWSSTHEVSLVNANTPHPILVAPDVFGNETVKFVLTVNDGLASSEPDTMNLFVNALYDEYDTLVVYDTAYVVDVIRYYNTIMISVVDTDGDLIAREVEGVLYVKLYPNPADQFINVSSEMEIEYIEILTITGDQVKYQLVNALTAEINLSGFIAGNYILRLKTESGTVNKQFVLE